jgi:GntR family transcriptional regulator
MRWEPEIPRWRQVYAVMSERILDGTYPPGGRLPSAMAVCDEFAEMQPGIGTFVTELPQPPAGKS